MQQVYLRIEVKQGRRGRWRWTAYDESGHVWALAPVQGYDTAIEARLAATTVSNAEWLGQTTVDTIEPAPSPLRRFWRFW